MRLKILEEVDLVSRARREIGIKILPLHAALGSILTHALVLLGDLWVVPEKSYSDVLTLGTQL